MDTPSAGASPSLGGVWPLTVSLGAGPASDRAPGSGNDLLTRFREDLALAAEHGFAAVRVPFDWSRLQPREGRLDHDWMEWYDGVLDAARAASIEAWACLFESVRPRWFDDAGGFSDERTSGVAWPRYVEAVADRFGDRVSGWVPMDDPIGHAASVAGGDSARHQRTIHHIVVAWRDAWRILRGGAPVSTCLRVREIRATSDDPDARDAARREDALVWRTFLRGLRDGTVSIPGRPDRHLDDLAGATDLLGVSLSTDLGTDPIPTDRALEAWADRAGTLLRRVADEGPSRPVVVTYRPAQEDPDHRREVTDAFGQAVRHAITDGVGIRRIFLTPMIAGPGGPDAAFDRDRQPTPVLASLNSMAGPPPG